MGYLDEECKGCLGATKDPTMQARYTGKCSMLPRYKSLECPCLTCLIKVICEIDCELIKDYFIKTHPHRRIINERTQKYERLKYDLE